MDDLNKAFNHLFGFKVPIDDYDEFEKKVEEARELKEYLDKVEILKDISQIVTPVKMTNYERIKQMSIDEMAYLIMCPYNTEADLCNKNDCIGCTKEWLMKEVLENGND